jgi:hypothetical protein
MLPKKTVNVRIPPHLAGRFEELKARFGGLPPSTVIRFLVADVLERPMEELAEMVNRQIQKPVAKPAGKAEGRRFQLGRNTPRPQGS